MRARHHTPLRASGLAFAAFLLSGPLAAQEIGDAAAKRSSEVSAEIDRLTQAQDFAGAGKVAEEASQSFSKDGEDYLAAAYALKAAQQDAYLGDWKRIDELYFPRFDALLKQLDAGDPPHGDAFIHLMEYAKAGLGDRAAQKKLAAAYVSRIEARLGADSQEALMAPIDAALVSIKTGDAEEGLRRAMPALDAVAASPFHKLTMARYSEVAAALIDVAKRLDLAEQLFQSGSETQAAQQIIPEAGDFYTAWARLEVQKGEFLRSYELFEAALRIVGQIDDWGKAMALNNEYGNTLNNTGATGKAIIFMEDAIQIAEKNLGEDNDMTLELYASFAEISRNFGAPAVAVQSDMAVYEKRTARYGEKDEKALAAANGLGQDHLILGDFDEARRYFALTRKLAGQQGEDRDNIVANADAWTLLTGSLAAGGSPDKATAQRLLSIADDEDFAPVLRIRAAKRAAEGMKEAGDIDGAFALLKRTYQVSSQVFTGDHPLSFEIALRLADTVKDQDAQSALNIYDDLSEAMNRWIDEQNRLSNNTKVGELLRGHADALLADFAQFAETHDMAKASFFRAAYRWKTIVGGGMTAYRRLELQPSASDEKTESLIRNTLRLNAQMGAIMSSTPNDDTTGPMVRRYQETAQALMARLQQLGIEV